MDDKVNLQSRFRLAPLVISFIPSMLDTLDNAIVNLDAMHVNPT
jgi:hypothetical protein